MNCPFCGFEDTRVIETRIKEDVGDIRRRRECTSCKQRFSTLETLIKQYPLIVKKDNSREPFQPEKLKQGIQLACLKRPVSQSHIERAVEEISSGILEKNEKEIKALEIGQKVMNQLKKLDNVAYIRFASVYKDFKDVDEFVQTITEPEDELKK